MKKIMKLFLKIALLGVLLLAAGLLTLRFMFPPEKIKRLTLDYAHNTLHREVKFDSVSFNVIGVTLTNFAMSEENSFEQGTFIQADKLEAKVAFWPLLKKRVEISTIALNGITVNLIKQKDGSFNFDSLMTASTQPSVEKKPQNDSGSASTVAVTAQHISALDCDFNYQDLQTGFSTRVEDLNIRLSEFDLDAPFPVAISFTSQTQEAGGPSISVPVNIALKVFLADLNLPQAYVEITRADATYKSIKLALQGKIQNLKQPQTNLTGTIDGLDHTALVDFLPDLPHFTLPQIQVVLEAAADLETSLATIKQASLRVQDSTLNVNGSTSWAGENPSYQLEGKLHADIGQMVKMTDKLNFEPDGILDSTFTATDKKDGKDISGTLTLKNVSLLYPPFGLTKTNGTIKINSLDDISCASLSGLLNEEAFKGSFAYKNIQDVLDIVLKLDLDKLTLNEFPSFGDSSDKANESTQAADSPADAESAKENQPETLLNLTADITVGAVSLPYFRTDGIALQTALQNISETMQKASGTVSFTLEPGAVTDMDKLLKKSKIIRVILLPLGLLNSVGKKLNLNLFDASAQAKKGEVAITKGAGHYTFTNGLMNIDETAFESALTNIKANGTIDFVTNKLDMKASATLVTKQTPVIIKITGTVDNPSGKVDVLHTVGSVVGGILSYKTAKSAATGTVSAAGSVTTGAAKTTEQAAKGTVDAAKATAKALGSLFKKKQDAE